MFLKKRILLKFFAPILSILLVVASLAGCSDKSSKNEKGGKTSAVNEGTSKGSKDLNSPPKSDKHTNSGIPPISEGLTKYMEMKGKAFKMLEQLTDSIVQSGNAMDSLAMMPLMSADLTIMPLTMIAALPPNGNNSWGGHIAVMNEGTGRAELKGDICTFSMEIDSKEYDGGKITYSGEYDTKKDSLQVTFTVQGEESIFFEYVASGNGYVSQLYSKSNGSYGLIKNAFEENRLYAGVISDIGKPESIYQKNVSDWEGFAKSDSLMVFLENGKGYTIVDGKKYVH